MSFSDDGSYDDNINEDNINDFLDSDTEDTNNDVPKFKRDKISIEVDNDDNENDYIEDNPDADDETYENDFDETNDENEDNEDENEKNYIEDNINFNDNDLDNDSKFQYIVQSDDKITSNILTIYELIELISIRASQISNGSYVFTDITGISDPMEMAKKEIMDNKCPLYIKRYIGLDRYELWSPNLMSKPKI